MTTRSATRHFRIAWTAFKAHPRPLVISMLVLFASWVSLELTVVTLHRWGVVLEIALHVAFLCLFSGLMLGVNSMVLQVVEGGTPYLKNLTALLERGPMLLLACCLYFVGVAAGLVLFIVPGFYVAVRYALFGQVLATRRVSALEALREAGELTRGRWWETFGFLLVSLALNLAGAALLGLGLLISFPVSLLATASFFRTLQPPAAPSN